MISNTAAFDGKNGSKRPYPLKKLANRKERGRSSMGEGSKVKGRRVLISGGKPRATLPLGAIKSRVRRGEERVLKSGELGRALELGAGLRGLQSAVGVERRPVGSWRVRSLGSWFAGGSPAQPGGLSRDPFTPPAHRRLDQAAVEAGRPREPVGARGSDFQTPRVAEPGPSESPRGWPGSPPSLSEPLLSSRLRANIKAHEPGSFFVGFWMKVCGTLST